MAVQRTLSIWVRTIPAAVLLGALLGQAQGAAQAPAGGRDGTTTALWTLFDTDNDNSITRAEMKGTFDKWYDAADSAKTGSIAVDQLAAVLNAAMPQPAPADGSGGPGRGGAPPQSAPCGGRANLPTTGQTACPDDVTKMMAA